MVEQIIRILIVDDHKLVRMGMQAMMNTKPYIEVIGEASNGKEAVSQTEKLQPDIVLLDLFMPHLDGLEALHEILRANEGARVLVITGYYDDSRVYDAIKAGASGCVFKDSSPETLMMAIQAVYRGEIYLDPRIAMLVVHELIQPRKSAEPALDEALSKREIDVLKLISRGYTNREIAQQLCITERTVGSHVSTILSKLQLGNRTQAALHALRTGLVRLESRMQTN